jgi:hypothetical protein
VLDPEKHGFRVELLDQKASYMMVQARKINSVAIFAQVPLQSDYIEMWSTEPEAPEAPPKGLAGMIPEPLRTPPRAFRRKMVKRSWKLPFRSRAYQLYRYR